ncbi:hypothetical protein FHG87_022633, partial [Trinorchestia longiramus]
VGRCRLLQPLKSSTSPPHFSSPRPQLAVPSSSNSLVDSSSTPPVHRSRHIYLKETIVEATDRISVLPPFLPTSTSPSALFDLCQAKDKSERVIHRHSVTELIIIDGYASCEHRFKKQSSGVSYSVSDHEPAKLRHVRTSLSPGIHLEALSEFPNGEEFHTDVFSSSSTSRNIKSVCELDDPVRAADFGSTSVNLRPKFHDTNVPSNQYTVSSHRGTTSPPGGSAGCLDVVFPGVASVFGCPVPRLCGEKTPLQTSQPVDISILSSEPSTILNSTCPIQEPLNASATNNSSADLHTSSNCKLDLASRSDYTPAAQTCSNSASSTPLSCGGHRSLWSVATASHVTVAGTGYPARGGSSWPGLDSSITTDEHPRSHLPDLISPTTVHHQHHISSLYFSQDTNESRSIVEIANVIDINAPSKLETAREYVCQVNPLDLHSHPDLGPLRPSPPKSLPLVSSGPNKAKKNVENELSKESFAEKKVIADIYPEKKPESHTAVVEKESSLKNPQVPEVRQQIRECLDRVRSRRVVSTTSEPCSSTSPPAPPAGAAQTDSSGTSPEEGQVRSAASFAAGLYRLERLLRRGGAAAEPALRDTNLQGRPQHNLTPAHTREVATITDVHQSEQLDEVELISLVQEQIPRYKLRADPAAAAAGEYASSLVSVIFECLNV